MGDFSTGSSLMFSGLISWENLLEPLLSPPNLVGFHFLSFFPQKQQSGFHAPAPGFQPEMALDPLTQEYFKVPAPGYEADPSGMGAPGQTQSGSHSC